MTMYGPCSSTMPIMASVYSSVVAPERDERAAGQPERVTPRRARYAPSTTASSGSGGRPMRQASGTRR